jgi:ABC-type multidrug transport system fused ATPase/permease subunit
MRAGVVAARTAARGRRRSPPATLVAGRSPGERASPLGAARRRSLGSAEGGLIATLRNIFRILSPRERRQILLLLPLLVVSSLVEVVGIASIMPFLAIVADPELVERQEILRVLYEAGGFDSTRTFLIALGVLMFCFIVASNGLATLSSWALLRFSWMRSHTISLRILRNYLAKPYPFFLERHSADLGKNLLTEVNQVVAGTMVPAMKAATGSIAALAVLCLLVVIDSTLALLTAAIMGGAYAVTFFSIRRSQRRMGQIRLQANQERFETLSEAFGGIKEVKLLGRERDVLRRFARPSQQFAAATAKNAVVAQVPRYALEAIAFGGIVLIVLYLLGAGREFESILPVLGLYAFAGYRLMPSLQQIFHGLTSIRFNAASLEHLLADLPSAGADPLPPAVGRALPLRSSIRLRDVTYRYPTAKEPLFRGLDLEIEAGSSIALVGETGSGKSTLVDLVLGLLRPDSGVVEIDGAPLADEDVRAWQRNVGYVPQAIFLTNDTITRNIAFGLRDDEIDMASVERAARIAHIDELVRSELPHGYDTVVGERGVRLSGGQRQRIGIARALYRDPAVIVFDEATSALDSATEELVLRAVAGLARGRTLITIAHRLSTVRACDRIMMLSGGRVVDSGRYDDLFDSNAEFRALAAVTSSR